MLGQGSPIIHSSCEGELGVALESLQGKGDLTPGHAGKEGPHLEMTGHTQLDEGPETP